MQLTYYLRLCAAAVILATAGILLFPSAPSETVLNSAYMDACGKLVSQHACDKEMTAKITALKTGNKIYSLGNICATQGFPDTISCAQSCGCNVTGTRTALFETPLPVYSDNPVFRGVIEIEEDEE